MSIRKEAEGPRAHFITPLHEINAKNHQKVGTPLHHVNVCVCPTYDRPSETGKRDTETNRWRESLGLIQKKKWWEEQTRCNCMKIFI
jgi:hypothetical protein